MVMGRCRRIREVRRCPWMDQGRRRPCICNRRRSCRHMPSVIRTTRTLLRTSSPPLMEGSEARLGESENPKLGPKLGPKAGAGKEGKEGKEGRGRRPVMRCRSSPTSRPSPRSIMMMMRRMGREGMKGICRITCRLRKTAHPPHDRTVLGATPVTLSSPTTLAL